MKLEKMRLKISFLQKTPVWVFFCFCTVVLLLVPVESHATVAGSFSSGDYLALNQTMNDFENAARSWKIPFRVLQKVCSGFLCLSLWFGVLDKLLLRLLAYHTSFTMFDNFGKFIAIMAIGSFWNATHFFKFF